MASRNLSPAEQREVDARINKLELAQYISFLGGTVNNCFSDCVNGFTSKSLTSGESSCIERCVEKTIASTQRLRDRFVEHQTIAMQQMQNAAPK